MSQRWPGYSRPREELGQRLAGRAIGSVSSRPKSDTSVIHGHWPDRSDVVGVGRFELPASCSQIGKVDISGCVGLCRFVLECSDLAGVMGAESGTDQHRTTQPGAYRIDTSLIHGRVRVCFAALDMARVACCLTRPARGTMTP